MTIDLIRPYNTLDYDILEPGDILLVANPTDMPLIRYLIFWSHVGVVSTRGTVIDAVREPRGEHQESQRWYQVQEAPLQSYRLAYDILAVRPRLPQQARHQAALYAESKSRGHCPRHALPGHSDARALPAPGAPLLQARARRRYSDRWHI